MRHEDEYARYIELVTAEMELQRTRLLSINEEDRKPLAAKSTRNSINIRPIPDISGRIKIYI